MKISAIGGTRKVGSAVVKELVERNATVRVLVRKKDSAANVPANVMDVFERQMRLNETFPGQRSTYE